MNKNNLAFNWQSITINFNFDPSGNNSAHHRLHGDFMWRQFYNMKRIGVEGIYISMWDEYNEANQIAKTDASQIPVGSGFVTLDEDGVRCSSDYYLRVTQDGGAMFKEDTPLTEERPTVHWINKCETNVFNFDYFYALLISILIYLIGNMSAVGPTTSIIYQILIIKSNI